MITLLDSRSFFPQWRALVSVWKWALCLMWGVPCGVWAQPASPKIQLEAQSYSYDRTSDTYTYRQAKLVWEKITLEAGTIFLDHRLNKVTATDYVRYHDTRLNAIVGKLELDLTTRRGTLFQAIVYDAEAQGYFTAAKIEKIGDFHFIATECTVTSCNPQNPAWRISSQSLDYERESFSSAQGAVLYLQEFPVFYFPYLLWPTVTKRQTGFLAPTHEWRNAGAEQFKLGYKFGLPFFWAIGKDQDLTLQMDVIERRGLGLGFDYQYAFREGLHGEIKFWQIHERDARDPSSESGRIPKEEIDRADLRPVRYKLIFNHNQMLDARSNLIFSGTTYSDSQFQREYDHVRDPNPNYATHLNATVSRQFEIGDASILFNRESVFQEIAILNRNVLKTRAERLPEFNLHLSGNPWSFPLTLELNSSLVRFHREEGFVGWREIMIPRLQYRFPLLEYFKGSISYGKRISFYQVYNPGAAVFFANEQLALNAREGRKFGYQIDLLEAEVNTTLSRLWGGNTQVFSRFKHMVTPRLLLQTIADVQQDKTAQVRFPEVRPLPSKPLADPVDYFDREDSLPGMQLLVFRLDNILLAKRLLQERKVKLTDRSLNRLKENQVSEDLLKKLDSLLNLEFLSEADFLSKLDVLFGGTLSPEQKELVLSTVQRGLVARTPGKNAAAAEGPSWVLSRLNLIQPYNLLLRNQKYSPKGPLIAEQETTDKSGRGNPLLPLQLEWYLNPGPRFSVETFTRYHYQQQRFVEAKSTFNVQVSPKNQAKISFHNNETPYRTPDNVFHEKTNTLSFSNVYEADEELSFGFAGKLNLNISDETSFRRRLVEDSFFIDFHPNCYAIGFQFKEAVDRIRTSESEQKEVVDRSFALNISLGQVLPLPKLSGAIQ